MGLIGRVQTNYKAVKLLFMIPQWWIQVIGHLSKPIGGTTQRVKAKYKLWTLGNDAVSMGVRQP